MAEGKTFTGCGRYCYSSLWIDVRVNSDGMSEKELMVEFMGQEFESSWDYTMSLIKKIYEISDPDMRELFPDLFRLPITSTKSTVQNAIIEFIEWHNQQKT